MSILWGKTQNDHFIIFFTLNITIRRLWANLYHKEDHLLKIWPLLHYFSEIYLKICDFALFKKKNFCALKKNMSIKFFDPFMHFDEIWSNILWKSCERLFDHFSPLCMKGLNTSHPVKDTRSDVFIVSFEHISHVLLVFSLLTLRR